MSINKRSPEWRTGVVAEAQVAAQLMRDGALVSQVGHAGDVAPALRGWHRHLTLPDFQVWWPKLRRATWVEVKCKSTFGVVRVMDNLKTTGIDLSKHTAYETVERVTGHPVLLVFVHPAQDVVLLADLHQHRVPSLGDGALMVFWDVSKLERLCSYEELKQATARPQRIDEPLFVPPAPAPMQLGLFDDEAVD